MSPIRDHDHQPGMRCPFAGTTSRTGSCPVHDDHRCRIGTDHLERDDAT